jgi:replicative DNA helicase
MTMENRRDKYTGAKVVKNKDLVIDVNFDITTLDLMCSYIVSDNKNIRRANIINLRNLFLIMDMNNYGNDRERLNRIDFINKGIDARLNHGLSEKNMILTHIAGGFGMNSDVSSTFREINNDELDWINKTVSETLKYSIIYNDVDKGLALLTKFKSVDYANRGPIVKDIEQWITEMQVKFRRAKANNVSECRFSLVGDDYENSMRETYRKLASPSNRLVFGVQALNALTGGGVESGRVYTLLGLPGEGKSTTLLDMAIQLKRYNANYVCKDPTKKPCVVLLTMENSVKEDVQRLFSMCNDGNDMLNYTEDEALNVLKTTGRLKVDSTDPVNIFIIFQPNLSKDTSYLYEMVEDLEDEGYETICVLQDYLKRIRSVDGMFGGDLRLQLGSIVNEFKVFATLKDIPVITASQLNRDATKHIDEARQVNKADLVRLLGRSNVGESNLILENSDWIALIAPEYDRDGNKLLGIQRCKSRYYIPGDFAYAYLPYITNTVKFIEDYYSPVPVHKITLREQMEMNTGGINPNNVGVVNEIKEFTEFNEVKLPTNNDNNIFLNASAVVARNIYMKKMCEIIRA